MNQVITSPDFRRDIYTVTRLNTEARAVLEANFGALWIEGELSNVARPRSGHIYFSLKDDQAQVRCAMFRQNNRHLDFEPKDGSQVLVRGRVGLYRDRGDFQLIVEFMELAGDGALRRAYEALKQRLSAEGLFAEEAKVAPPTMPTQIGVITSPTGAAVRDVLRVLERRFPAMPIVIYPTLVQGDGAGGAIARAIDLAVSRAECDVLLLVRGGGSLEDLWAFNEEVTARAIARATIPIVCGVGHETDVTIADFVADARAPTPSAAAELVSPDQFELTERVDGIERRLIRIVRAHLTHHQRELGHTARRLVHPRTRLRHMQGTASELGRRLGRALAHRLDRMHQRLARLDGQLAHHHPERELRARHDATRDLTRRLERSAQARLAKARQRLDHAGRALHAISPERTLERGYAIVTTPEGRLIRDAGEVTVGASLETRLASGKLRSTVDEVQP